MNKYNEPFAIIYFLLEFADAFYNRVNNEDLRGRVMARIDALLNGLEGDSPKVVTFLKLVPDLSNDELREIMLTKPKLNQ